MSTSSTFNTLKHDNRALRLLGRKDSVNQSYS